MRDLRKIVVVVLVAVSCLVGIESPVFADQESEAELIIACFQKDVDYIDLLLDRLASQKELIGVRREWQQERLFIARELRKAMTDKEALSKMPLSKLWNEQNERDYQAAVTEIEVIRKELLVAKLKKEGLLKIAQATLSELKGRKK